MFQCRPTGESNRSRKSIPNDDDDEINLLGTRREFREWGRQEDAS